MLEQICYKKEINKMVEYLVFGVVMSPFILLAVGLVIECFMEEQ
jgi:hypothetical protein